ncbi:protein HEXIM2-like [Apostichopus japonicus]
MDGDDERTDKESEKSQPASPQNNSKTNTAIITDSSSGENGNQHRAEGRRRKSRRNQRNNSKTFNREGHHIRQRVNTQDSNLIKEDASAPAQRRKRRRRNHQRKYKPYTKLSWEERMERDEAESERATKRRANRPTPYNTTQFLMEDHKADTPDLSGITENNDNDTSEEIFEEDFRNGEYLEKNFSAVYDEVQTERLQSMSKEQLVNEVLALSKRVAELEESQQKLKSDQGDLKGETIKEEKTDLPVLPLSETLMDVPYLQKEVEKSTTPEQNS